MAMHTKPPSWSVAAMSRCRWAARSFWIIVVSAAAELALWLRFTTRRPPYWCCAKSARTESVSAPWKPTIITAPISSSRVRPPGPRSELGDAGGEAEAAGDGEGEGEGTAAWLELEHAPTSRTAAIAARCFRDTVLQRTRDRPGYVSSGGQLRGRFFSGSKMDSASTVAPVTVP